MGNLNELVNYVKRSYSKRTAGNYKILEDSIGKILHDLCFIEEQFQRALRMKNANPSDAWKLRDYLLDKLKAEGKTAYSFSALADPSANKWFTYQKTW